MTRFGKIVSMLAIIMVAFVAVACAGTRVKPSKNIITENVTLDKFDAIELNGSISVIYEKGSTCKAVIKAPDNVMPLIVTDVSGGKLKVGYKRGTMLLGKGNVTVSVTAPRVTGYTVNGSGDITLKSRLDATSGDVSMTVNGSGGIYADVINCSSLKCIVNGSGDVEIGQKVTSLGEAKFVVNGSGDIKAKSVKGDDVRMAVNGSGDLSVDMANCEALVANVSGSGDLDCSGIKANSVKSDLSGSGDISLRGRADAAELYLGSSGDLSAGKLVAGTVKAKVDGSGSIRCHAVKSLNTDVSGSGDIRYSGSPQLQGSKRNVKHD